MLIKRIALKGLVMPVIYRHYLLYSLLFLVFKNYIGLSWIVSRRFKACFYAYWVQLDRGAKRTKHVQEGKQRWVLFFFSAVLQGFFSLLLKKHEDIAGIKSIFLECHGEYKRACLVSEFLCFSFWKLKSLY